jgi:hypothetical protein
MIETIRTSASYLRRKGIALSPRSFVIGLQPLKKFIAYWLPGERVGRKSRMINPLHFFALIAPSMLARPGSKVYV